MSYDTIATVELRYNASDMRGLVGNSKEAGDGPTLAEALDNVFKYYYSYYREMEVESIDGEAIILSIEKVLDEP